MSGRIENDIDLGGSDVMSTTWNGATLVQTRKSAMARLTINMLVTLIGRAKIRNMVIITKRLPVITIKSVKKLYILVYKNNYSVEI